MSFYELCIFVGSMLFGWKITGVRHVQDCDTPFEKYIESLKGYYSVIIGYVIYFAIVICARNILFTGGFAEIARKQFNYNVAIGISGYFRYKNCKSEYATIKHENAIKCINREKVEKQFRDIELFLIFQPIIGIAGIGLQICFDFLITDGLSLWYFVLPMGIYLMYVISAFIIKSKTKRILEEFQ